MRIKKLLAIINRYLKGTASTRENETVDSWYEAIDTRKTYQPPTDENLSIIKEHSYTAIMQKIEMDPAVIPFYKKKIWRVAAAVFILIGTGLFITLSGDSNNNTVARTSHVPTPALDVAPPKNNKAILTLSDGRKIVLDSSGNGTLTTQGNVSVVKKENGVIQYEGKTSEIAYNTLQVPKGSKPLKLALSDGSLVWVNVASSITFPVTFSGNERKVEISGEVYFEIAKNDKVPFIVKKNNSGAEIKVLGTHFNVNAYDDEENMKVTLLEGSVQTSLGIGKPAILSPGQQARVNANSIEVTDDVDLNEVMAWKDGRFYFDGADIKIIMRQIEKWYDVDVNYVSDIKYSFVAKISRDVNASEILKIFEMTDLVHFKIEGRKITIME